MKTPMPARIKRLLEKALEPFQSRPESIPVWRESGDVCALADSERHLGHAVRVDKHWIAYDAIHFNPSNDGFRIIGTFQTIAAAKRAIESSVRLSWVWAVGGATSEREVKTDLRTFERLSRNNPNT
jgi:hypothetical protein